MKKKLQNEIIIIVMIIVCCVLFGVLKNYQNKETKESVMVGISFPNVNNAWNTIALKNILQECENEKISTVWRTSGGSIQQQKKDIEELMNYQPRYLVVMPGNSVGLKEILEKAAQETKIILFCGEVSGLDEKNIYWKIQTDSYGQGSMAAELMAEYMGTKEGRILELQSDNAFSETKKKGIGFRKKLCEYDNLEIGYVMRNLDKRIDTYNAVVSYLADEKEQIDAIMAYDDDTAMGAIAALETLNRQILVVAIGGTQDTEKAVQIGKIEAIIEVDTDAGTELTDRIMNDLEGKSSNVKGSLEFKVVKYEEVENR